MGEIYGVVALWVRMSCGVGWEGIIALKGASLNNSAILTKFKYYVAR
jgi:hypothetical protein